MNRKISTLLLAASAVVLNACSEEVQVTEPPLRPVRFVEASLSGTAQNLTFSGTSHAGLESRMSFKVGGTIKRKLVKVGDKVSKGQVLIELDPKDYQVSLQQAQAALDSAQASERNARSNYERIRKLYESNNASANELESARANADSSKANVVSSRKQVESARNQLRYTRLSSPDACAVASIDVRENENVNAAQQVIQLNCGEEPEVKITVPENYISQVKVGDKATVTFDAVQGHHYEATVTEVGVAASAGLAFPVTVKLSKQDANIRAGMAASVALLLAADTERENVIYLPSNAVGEDRQGRFVWLVENTETDGVGVIQRRNVTVDKLTARGLEVVSGLKGGERVASAGTTFLAEGMNVRIPGVSEE